MKLGIRDDLAVERLLSIYSPADPLSFNRTTAI